MQTEAGSILPLIPSMPGDPFKARLFIAGEEGVILLESGPEKEIKSILNRFSYAVTQLLLLSYLFFLL